MPKSFKKPSYQKSIPLSFHLTYQEDLEDKSFIINNEEYDVPCIFQIWERKSIHRDLPILLQAKGFEFVKKNNNPDYSLRRVGVYAGKIDAEIDSKSEQSHYFITLNKKDNNFIERYNHSVKFEHNNTVGANQYLNKNLLLIKLFNDVFWPSLPFYAIFFVLRFLREFFFCVYAFTRFFLLP